MNLGKKISWQLAAVSAAALLSGTAFADGRGHDRGWHDQSGRHDNYADRAWRRNHHHSHATFYSHRDHGRYDYRDFDNCPPRLRHRAHYWAPVSSGVRVVIGLPLY